jgi:WD40 repeat protein
MTLPRALLVCVFFLQLAACNYPGIEPTTTTTPTAAEAASTATFTPTSPPKQSRIDASNAAGLSLAGESVLGEVISLSWDLPQGRAVVATLEGVRVLQFNAGVEQVEIVPSSSAEISVAELAGKYLGLGHVDGGLTVWDLELDQELYTRAAGVDTVTAIAFSPGGGILGTGTLDGSAALWSVETGRPFQEYQFESWPESITFSPIGELVGMDIVEQSVQVFSARSGELVHELTWDDRAGPIYYVDFSPDWNHIVWISRASALVMELDSGEPITLLGHEDFIGTTAYAPDGTVYASTTAEFIGDELQGVVKVWSMPDGDLLHNLVTGQGAVAIDFSPDARLLALGMPDGTVQFWEISTGMQAGEIHAHSDLIFDLSFMQDGKSIVTVSIDGSLRVWSH